MTDPSLLEKITALCKRRGFIYQGSEIYGGLAGTWDYGPLGVALKKNIENLWWQEFIGRRDDIYGLDSAIMMPARVWQASGHLAGFTDPLEVAGQTRKFNLMFKTEIGASADSESVAYLRPETAQGMFTNFKNVIDSFHPKLPFGLAQIGKCFRNEIAPRDFLFRAREFEIMEIEYFIRAKDWEEKFEVWHQAIKSWLIGLGLPENKIYEEEVTPVERAHYSSRTIDFQFDFPFGRKELCGLAYRSDFDLRQHAAATGVDLTYQDEATNEKFIPHVIEPTFGLDRLLLAILTSAYSEDTLGGESRVYLKLAPLLAPIRLAVFPLLKNKPQLVERARIIFRELKATLGNVAFDDNGNIGKRYRRQDEIGTPWCVTIDFQTLEDDTVTIRARDSGLQERVAVSEIPKYGFPIQASN